MWPSYPSRPAKSAKHNASDPGGVIRDRTGVAARIFGHTGKTPDVYFETLARLPPWRMVPAFPEATEAGKVADCWAKRPARTRKKNRMVAQHLPKSQMSEAFRALRTALLLFQADHPPQVILVTSACRGKEKRQPQQIWRSPLAQLGDRHAIDRRGFKKAGSGPAVEYVGRKVCRTQLVSCGVSSLELVTVPHPLIPNLVAIPTGPLPPNPADLLSSHQIGGSRFGNCEPNTNSL